ncbi:fumarylacetoacetate hydrolase family protein [Nocardia sp. XZ_19_369]|uniref:fumarylacetoacetate hydrolase family protein n=1 Tax=Nocardia sp. XZ_19_369 TaxID=2769487 RepID=UPI00188FFD4A|nr:fumarylacetoacetate hydrolase family protein [Nocardia sp. XZ_19_369]
MKLATYLHENSPGWGVVNRGRITPVRVTTEAGEVIDSMDAYLRHLPDSNTLVKDFAATQDAGLALEEVTLLAPVPRPAALLDCAVSPRHIRQASETLIRRSLPWPLRPASTAVGVAIRYLFSLQGDTLRYYKGRVSSVVGDGAVIPWPRWISYLDVEPELAVVVGDVPRGASRTQAAECIAGYTVFNDVSGRDLQLSEMFGFGLSASKDMDAGNVLGPWLVTPDQVGDARTLAVDVKFADGRHWQGSTTEYVMDPVDVIVELAARQSLAAGTVIGMGTVPDTCGLDRDEWVSPGSVEITIEHVGTLRQIIDAPTHLDPTRWTPRPSIIANSNGDFSRT